MKKYNVKLNIVFQTLMILLSVFSVVIGSLFVSYSSNKVFANFNPLMVQYNQTQEQESSSDKKNIEITTYKLNDNTGYNINSSDQISNDNHLLKDANEIGKTFLNLSVIAESDFPQGETSDGRVGAFIETTNEQNLLLKQNGINAYGVSGSRVYIGLNYNFDKILGFVNYENVPKGTKSNIEFSSDTATSIGGKTVGEIKYGGILIQKKTSINDIYQMQTKQGETFDNIHTTDLTTWFSPEIYVNGYETAKLFQLSGQDINNGVFIQIQFAYELKYTYSWHEQADFWHWWGEDKSETVYVNMLEVAEFYVVQNSGVVSFHNASTTSTVENEGTSEAVRQAGTILSGHTSFNGFRLNTLGASYQVEYSKNFSSFALAEDGQFFSEQGRYDFKITTKLGKVREHVIFIDKREINDAVWAYFGESLLTSKGDSEESLDSYRLFTTGELPTYLAEQTYYHLNSLNNLFAKAYGRIYKESDVEGDERVFIAEITQENPDGTILEEGIYTADFYTDYGAYGEAFGISNCGSSSGDSYHFIFKFEVVDKETPSNPFVNEEYLNSFISVSDLMAKYYAITLQSSGTGKVAFAFADYFGAYNFAYNYERSFIEILGDNQFQYKSLDDPQILNIYNSQFSVLEAVDKYAEELIEIKYFDASEPQTYQTANIADEAVLNFEFEEDIVIFLNDIEQELATDSNNFLNGRKYRSVNSDGTISDGIIYPTFLAVGEFETKTITLINKTDPTIEFNIVYGVSIEQQLLEVNAPSGKYIVKEENKYGTISEYEVTYICNGEMSGVVTFEVFHNGETETKIITNLNNEQTIFANGFVLKSITNELDKHSIIKISKDGAQQNIFEFNEVQDLIFYEAGEYLFTFVDRLGNLFNYNVIITDQVGYQNISFVSEDETVQNTFAFIGQTITFPIPDVAEGFEFMGWQCGEIFAPVGENFTLISNEDLDFVEVLHFIETTITLYDGEIYTTLTAKPDDRVLLPFPEMAGFSFIGWGRELDSELHIYYGQITSLDNVSEIRLDALWIANKNYDDNDILSGFGDEIVITYVDGTILNSFTVTVGTEITLSAPSPRAGFEFVGWFERVSGINGYIWSGTEVVEADADNKIVFEAIWKGISQQEQQNAPTFAETINPVERFFNNLANGLTTAWNNGFDVALFVLLGITVFAVVSYYLSKKLKMENRQWKINGDFAPINFNTQYIMHNTQLKHNGFIKENKQNQNNKDINQLLTNENLLHNEQFNKVKKEKNSYKFKKPVKFKLKHLMICVSFVMSILFMGIVCLEKLPSGVFENNSQSIVQSSQLIDEDENKEKHLTKKEVLNKFNDLSNQVISQFSTLNSRINNSSQFSGEIGEEEQEEQVLTDDEAFLFALAAIDLLGLGYTVFPAIAVKNDETEIKGLAYTDFIDGFTQEEDERVYFGSGFVALPYQQIITNEEVEEGIKIYSLDENGEKIIDDEYGYILSFSESYENSLHYISNEKYVTYKLNGYNVEYEILPNLEENYNLSLGALYSYDLERNIFDPDLGQEFNITGTSINSLLDPVMAQAQFNAYVAEQTKNGFTVDTLNFSYISLEALDAVILGEQEESFLGLSPDEIYEYEKNLAINEYYAVVTDEEGNSQLTKFELPQNEPELSFWEKIKAGFSSIVVGVGMIVVGVVIASVVSCFASPALGQIVMGAFMGAGIELVMQGIDGKSLSEVNWLKVGVAAVSGAICAIPGMAWWGAALVGGLSQAATTAIDGGSLEECLLSFATGVAIGVAIHFAGKLLNKAVSKIKGKLDCFVAGTLILLADGTVKTIEDIKVGDKVKSYNEITKLIEYKTVSQTFTSEHDELINITVAEQTISSTINHPFLTQRGWVEASKLKVGDILLTDDYEKLPIEKIVIQKLEEQITFYNFEVRDNHNYFVAEVFTYDEYVLVHNACDNIPNNIGKVGPYKNVRVDVEMGGSGLVNTHIHVDRNKYIYNSSSKIFEGAPNIINKSQKVKDALIKGIAEALKRGWKL